ncbi:exosortase H [Comamonas sp.]|uniref:exosortase H n=1 Tax=Comamonas sp. TaxID=34028 RepID=UPI0025855385|nr:exosortase H [Comamonas sp.]
MLRFFLVFLGIQLTLFGLNLLNWVQKFIVIPWTNFLANFCAKLVLIFDSSAAATGKILWNTTNGFGVSIEAGCNGLEAFIILIAAVAAFPTGWKNKLAGLIAGFLAIQLLNVVRVISLFYLGQWNIEIFNFAHEYVWQALIMLDVLIFWLLWVGWSTKIKGNEANSQKVANV